MNNESSFSKGLGWGSGLLTAPIILILVTLVALVLLCGVCCVGLSVLNQALPSLITPTPVL